MYPHRIRLRSPWECEPLAYLSAGREMGLPTSGRTAMPGRWVNQGLAGFAGRVRHRRHFGSPANIDADERVWLTFGGIADHADILLNDVCLGRKVGSNAEFEITSLLKPRNVLTAEVECATDQGGLWGEVALEVRRKAFLRQVRTEGSVRDDTGILTIEGEIVGEAPGTLELYVILGRGNVAYAQVTPRPEGEAFRLISEPLTSSRWRSAEDGGATATVQVDLVNGGEVWYTWRAPSSWHDASSPGTRGD